jgi:hypothetical protein
MDEQKKEHPEYVADEEQSTWDRSAVGRIQNRLEDTYRKYSRTFQEIYNDTQRRLEDAYYDYMRALREAWTSTNCQTLAAEAARAYSETQQNAWMEHHRRTDDAFRDYVQELKDLWAQVDFDSLDTESMAALGNSMLWVATHAPGAPKDRKEGYQEGATE